MDASKPKCAWHIEDIEKICNSSLDKDMIEIHLDDVVFFLRSSETKDLEKLILLFNYCKSLHTYDNSFDSANSIPCPSLDTSESHAETPESLLEPPLENKNDILKENLFEEVTFNLNSIYEISRQFECDINEITRDLLNSFSIIDIPSDMISNYSTKLSQDIGLVIDELYSLYITLFNSLLFHNSNEVTSNASGTPTVTFRTHSKRPSRGNIIDIPQNSPLFYKYTLFKDLLKYWKNKIQLKSDFDMEKRLSSVCPLQASNLSLDTTPSDQSILQNRSMNNDLTVPTELEIIHNNINSKDISVSSSIPQISTDTSIIPMNTITTATTTSIDPLQTSMSISASLPSLSRRPSFPSSAPPSRPLSTSSIKSTFLRSTSSTSSSLSSNVSFNTVITIPNSLSDDDQGNMRDWVLKNSIPEQRNPSIDNNNDNKENNSDSNKESNSDSNKENNNDNKENNNDNKENNDKNEENNNKNTIHSILPSNQKNNNISVIQSPIDKNQERKENETMNSNDISSNINDKSIDIQTKQISLSSLTTTSIPSIVPLSQDQSDPVILPSKQLQSSIILPPLEKQFASPLPPKKNIGEINTIPVLNTTMNLEEKEKKRRQKVIDISLYRYMQDSINQNNDIEDLSLPKTQVYLWGSIGYNECHLSANEYMFPNLYTQDIVDIASGETSSIFLTSVGDVYIYTHSSSTPPVIIQQFSINRTLDNIQIISIAAGQNHFLALTSEGTVYSWGDNYYGELGHNDMKPCKSPRLITELLSENIRSVKCGYNNSCAITAGNDVYVWGCNEEGQLAVGTTENVLKPIKISFFVQKKKKIVECSLGYDASFFISQDGCLYGCGSNEYLQLGHIDYSPITVPITINGFKLGKNQIPVKTVVSGCTHCIALDTNGSLYAWGSSIYGSLGVRYSLENTKENYSPISLSYPTPIYFHPPLLPKETIVDLQAGLNHNIIRTSLNHIYIWGLNASGCLAIHSSDSIIKDIYNNEIIMCPTLVNVPSDSDEYINTNDIRNIVFVKAGCFTTFIVKKNSTYITDNKHKVLMNTPADPSIRYKQYQMDNPSLDIWTNKWIPSLKNDISVSEKISSALYQGVPASIRGQIWILLIGNNMKISKELYKRLEGLRETLLLQQHMNCSRYLYSSIYSTVGISKRSLHRTDEGKDGDPINSSIDEFLSFSSIQERLKVDVPRTFNESKLFINGSILSNRLYKLMELFTCWRSDIGYHQAMSYIGGVLTLLINDEYLLFVAFTNLMTKYHFLSFIQVNDHYQQQYSSLFSKYLLQCYPSISNHLQENTIMIGFFFLSWMQTLYLSILPLSMAYRLLDFFFYDGPIFLYKLGYAILYLFKDDILSFDQEQLYALLTKNNSMKDLWQSRITLDKVISVVRLISIPQCNQDLQQISHSFWNSEENE
ncbi:hypothetical protein WA158_001950 [Blastocystis sp. Blastoise]